MLGSENTIDGDTVFDGKSKNLKLHIIVIRHF